MRLNGRAGSTLWLIGLCGALVALSACQASMEDVIAENRGPVEAAFERLRSLETTVRNTPPVAEDHMALGDEKVVLDGEGENALFIPAGSLSAPEYTSTDDTGATHAHTLQACGDALTGEAMGHPGAYADYLQECANAKYLFVLRTHDEESAQIVNLESFQPGRYEGDVLLLRIADGAVLGGFKVAAVSSDSIMAQADASGNATDIGERLDSDLDSNVFAAINDQIREHVPDAIK